MVNYALAKIYKIEPISGGEEDDVYIGSTAMPRLSTRMAYHRGSYKRWKDGKNLSKTTSFDVFEKYGIENCQITLIESISAETKDEMFACERKWIQSQRCVNKNVAGRTLHQYRQDNRVQLLRAGKQYYQDNREHIKQYRQDNREHKQQYRQDNRVQLLRAEKQYRQDNRERLIRVSKKCRDQHKESRQQYNKTYRDESPIITCACGSIFKQYHKSIHEKTNKHQQFCTTIV
jgi:hypothetical protein